MSDPHPPTSWRADQTVYVTRAGRRLTADDIERLVESPPPPRRRSLTRRAAGRTKEREAIAGRVPKVQSFPPASPEAMAHFMSGTSPQSQRKAQAGGGSLVDDLRRQNEELEDEIDELRATVHHYEQEHLGRTYAPKGGVGVVHLEEDDSPALKVLQEMAELVGTNWDGDICPICLATEETRSVTIDGCDHTPGCPWPEAVELLGRETGGAE